MIGTGSSHFPSAQMTQSALLKIIQEAGTLPLFVNQTGLDEVIAKKGESWDGGKIRTYNLTLDGGYASMGGFNMKDGAFLSGDFAHTIQGYLQPKFQSMTMLYQRMLNKFTASEAAAYIGHLKLETKSKASGIKSMQNTWLLNDGTGRIGTPVGLGANSVASGANFTIPSPSTPLKVKLSSLSGAVGNVVSFFEGMVVSFIYPNYDPNNDTTPTTNNTSCAVHYLTLAFTAGSTTSYYDSFRVVKIDVRNNEIELVPARESAPAGGSYAPTAAYAPNETWVQKQGSTTMWCAGSGTTTIVPFHGSSTANALNGTYTQIPDLNNLFAPETAFSGAAYQTGIFIVPTNYIPAGTVDYGTQNTDFSAFTSTSKTNAEIARLILGFGWTDTTELTLINPYVPTGMMALVTNTTNTVNGINRTSVPQINPTKRDCGKATLTFDQMFKFVTDHANRNKDLIPDWSVLLMGTLAYESMINQSELDRRITEAKGIRGEDSAQMIRINGKNFQFESHTAQRNDYINALPKGVIEMHGGKFEPVTAGSQSEFLQLANGRRINNIESYQTVVLEYCLRMPRASAFMTNYNLI